MAEPGSSESNVNVFRDGQLLVAPLEDAVFPNRCMKTNEPVESADFNFIGDLFPSQVNIPKSAAGRAARAAEQAVFGGGVVTELIRKRRVEFRIGLAAAQQARSKWLWRYGLALIAACPLVIFALVVTAQVFDLAERLGVAGDPNGRPSSVMPIVCVAIGSADGNARSGR